MVTTCIKDLSHCEILLKCGFLLRFSLWYDPSCFPNPISILFSKPLVPWCALFLFLCFQKYSLKNLLLIQGDFRPRFQSAIFNSKRCIFFLIPQSLEFYFLSFNFTGSRVDLQCCVSFRFTAKWFSYTYTYSFSVPYWLLKSTE